MAKSSNKWYLFYIVHDAYRNREEIRAREFESELDMLVWWSKNPRTKSTNMHHVVSPDGLTKVPNDLYERLEVLRRELAEKEKQEAETEAAKAHDKKVATAKKDYRQRKTRQEQEAQCQ